MYETAARYLKELGLEKIEATGETRMFAGFHPDIGEHPGLAGLAIDRDDVLAESPLVTARTIELVQGTEEKVRLKIMVGARSGADARLDLALDLATLPRTVAVAPAERLGIQLGQFAWVEQGGRGEGFLAFSRNNVAVSLLNEGRRKHNLLSIAEALDDQLRASPEYALDQIMVRRPQIEAHYFASRRIDHHSFTPLILLARCPQGRRLTTRFECTHGAVRKIAGDPPRYIYESGEALGPQTLTTYVTSRTLLTTVWRIDFSIGAGDLGYAPGHEERFGSLQPR